MYNKYSGLTEIHRQHLFPGNGARKRVLLMVYIRIKVHIDLQVDKSPA
jgi:hypothetical protein